MDRSLISYSALALSSVILTVLTPGCETKQDTLLDTRGSAPRVVSVFVSPTSYDTDPILVSGGRNAGDPIILDIDVNVRVTHAAGTDGIKSVSYTLAGDDGDPDLSSGPLSDNGVLPDSVIGDGVFSRRVTFTFLREPTITVWLRVQAVDHAGFESNVVLVPLRIGGRNQYPVISNLVMPDTAYPATQSVFAVSLIVLDPDGAGDIARVERITSSGNKYPLAAVGGGVYAEQVSLNPAPTPGSYVFKFQATDRSGATSNMLQKTIVIR